MILLDIEVDSAELLTVLSVGLAVDVQIVNSKCMFD